MSVNRTKVIACQVLMHEISQFMPAGTECEIVDVGLHVSPQSLNQRLRQAIEGSSEELDRIILGYGLCCRAVEGLKSRTSTLIVPRVDDCIGILLGSRQAHKAEVLHEPGTYYLTRGWIDAGRHLFEEYGHMCSRFGQEKADKLMSDMLKHYTRLAFVRTTPDEDMTRYLEYCHSIADRFDLRFEEISGTLAFVERMILGPWDEEFVCAPPGTEIPYEEWLGDPTPTTRPKGCADRK